jgi:maltooligosyltrehalose trehalohydrolase
VIDPGVFVWTDGGWPGRSLSSFVIYELHVGTFTRDGTFEGVVDALGELASLGVTAVEVMPVGQFPGARNWGYDGVFPFAAQNTYGGPAGLARLVDACHAAGLAFVLDVVDNHFGPEGATALEFGPYTTDRYRTPWGDAVNVDGAGGDEVRRFFIENALQWFEDFHVDALRLDAIHGIVDVSPRPFLAELAEEAHALSERLGRPLHLIAESDLGNPAVIRAAATGGLGLDAQWADDVHHSIHALLTGERHGYYRDFGTTEHLVRALRDGYTYTGQYSEFRQRRHGAPTDGIPGERFVACIQNHDQVGNRPRGERLSELVDFESLKLAAGLLLLSPFVPLLFMGEEYGETAPFLYFVDHGDPKLVEAVRRGRRAEYEWLGDVPDPADPDTFERSKLHRELRSQGRYGQLQAFYRELLRLRREIPALALCRERSDVSVADEQPTLLRLTRRSEVDEVLATFNLGDDVCEELVPGPELAVLVDSAGERWGGPGSLLPNRIELETSALRYRPRSFAVFHRPVDSHG